MAWGIRAHIKSNSHHMKVKSVDIEHFRGLDDIHIHRLDKHVNLFVGINGAGKSSVLDAMSLVFSWFTARMSSPKGRGRDIPKDDIAKQSPDGCTVALDIDGAGVWKLYRSLKYRKTDKSDLSNMTAFVTGLRGKLDDHADLSLPIVVHYGVNRVIPNIYPRLPRGKSGYVQLDAYTNALNGTQLFSDLFNWFRLSEDYENERYKESPDYRDPGLEAVRACMSKVMPDYHDLKVTRRPLALTMRKGNEVFKINQLSDGEKCYISLVCDIARRLAIANPSGNPLQGEGIVLIDEIELHLHPKLQQTVVSKLVRTFPNCQFFITTHSPIVASDVDGCVFGIDNGVVTERQTFGRLSSSILSSVFDVSMARSLHVQSIIEAAYDSISRSDQQSFYRNFDELVRILGADDPEVIDLRIEKMRRDKPGLK